MKLHITEKAIRELEIPHGRRSMVVFDTEVTGFGAQLTRAGAAYYVVVYRDAQGKQRQEKLADVGPIAAHAAREMARGRLQQLAPAAAPRRKSRKACQTFEQYFFGTYIPMLRGEGKNYQTHASIYRNHVRAALGQSRLDDITPDMIFNLQEALSQKTVADGRWSTQTNKLSDGTVKRVLILVRHVFNVAIRDTNVLVSENPTKLLRITTERSIKGKFLTAAEAQRLLQSAYEAGGEDMRSIVALMLLTGLRRANVLGMKWSWVDLTNGSLTVPAAEDKAKKGFTLMLSDIALGILRKRFSGLLEGVGSEYVFANPATGKPYWSRWSLWHTVRTNAGLGSLRQHDLRHTFASTMLDSGSDIVDVQQALAHTQLKTTAVYLHLRAGRKKEKANAAAQALGFC